MARERAARDQRRTKRTLRTRLPVKRNPSTLPAASRVIAARVNHQTSPASVSGAMRVELDVGVAGVPRNQAVAFAQQQIAGHELVAPVVAQEVGETGGGQGLDPLAGEGLTAQARP